MKLVLASTSPRRKELLNSLGLPFETAVPSFQERPTSLPAPEEALYFAEQKARSVEKLYPGSWIIAADTLIDCGGVKLGKPLHQEAAVGMLRKLSGRTHQLFTAVVFLDTKSGRIKRHLEKAEVTFRKLSMKEIRDYVATGEPFGKAGGYAVQGEGRRLIVKVAGDEEAVIGLPLKPLRGWLAFTTPRRTSPRPGDGRKGSSLPRRR